MGATWRPWVNVSDAPANGEASNNTIEVVRNWRRCMDLELIGELSAKLGERRGLDFRTSSILTIFGDVNHHASRVANAQSNFSIGSKVSTPNATDGVPIGEA